MVNLMLHKSFPVSYNESLVHLLLEELVLAAVNARPFLAFEQRNCQFALGLD